VSGTLAYDGAAHAVSGSGYHDHNWGNVDLNSVLSHWYWGRAHVGDYSLIFVEMNAVQDYGYMKIPVFMLAKGSQILIGDGTPLSMDARNFVSHPGGRDYPNEVDFNWQSGAGCVKLCLRRPEIIEASSLLGLLPRWQQRIARLVANPYYFRFNSNLRLDIDLPIEQASVQGRALFEIMMLR
jgi:predicted secreted hydrolase